MSKQYDDLCALSASLMQATIAEAEKAHQAVTDNWAKLHGIALAELRAANEPDPDPQVEATKGARGFPAAAEIKLGKRQVEAAAVRDRAVADAYRQHQDRLAAIAKRTGVGTNFDVLGDAGAAHAQHWLTEAAPLTLELKK